MMNNRKYLTSTGVLLKNLNEDSSNYISQNQSVYQSGYNQSNQFNQAYQQQNNYSSYQYNSNQMYNPQYNVPDIMVLPNSMSQHKWQQKPSSKLQNYQKHPSKIVKNSSLAKKTLSTSSLTTLSNSSSVTELPETFGLPSNQTSKSSISISKHTSSTNLEKQQSEIILDDSVKSPQKSEDIEIISEINTSQNEQDLNINLKNYLKNYSTKNLNLPIATKPQSNFVSNFNLIDQLIKKTDFYTNKLKRCKPYSTVKANQILNIDDSDSDSENEQDGGDRNEKVKNKKIILIDDSNEEMHKPWITPELIKLIKHRNLLQSKLGPDSETTDPELLKKFKNLRNKVTKLVKKARKDYLTKYIQESKENKIKPIESEKVSAPTTTSNVETAKKSPEKETEPKPTTLATTSNKDVNEITNKLSTSGSFLKDTSVLMMSLYTNYFNEYMTQYTKQQKQAQELAAKMTSSEKKEGEDGYDSLQKQAQIYAQQQLVIQQQLEKSLTESAQQLIQEIAEAAAAKANQPFVLNQFSQQHHMHHHHMHVIPGGQMSQPMMQQPQMITLVPPPPSATMSQAPIGIPPKGYY
ncbi:unnamed protein product [Brachionus calyciflorus]|uniref:Uncharacterized protein n=1 Tax=Brachionus calyciflorus TaxID=104777 RepID=A0A813LWF8_9BILA|nr:unnamed protein product [Brachionus calyciflorus]